MSGSTRSGDTKRRGFLHPVLWIGLAAFFSACGGPEITVPLYDNLGVMHHEISSAVPEAQQYFDQGLRLVYGFNHAEAIRSFEQAIEFDGQCAMCYWGVALAHGPNINAAMDSAAGVAAFAAAQRALELVADPRPLGSEGEADPRVEAERAYVEAIAARYVNNPLAERPRLDSAYATAMEDVADRLPQDPDAQVLHAAALMNLSPWDYWTPAKEPRPGTTEILRRLRETLTAQPDHPGACHYYIHAVEATYPERAVSCAERLPDLMPGAGHLVHMPGHVYIRVGRYIDAIERNEHAVHADEEYIAEQHPSGIYPLAYYPHNFDFLAFAAAMAGKSEQALGAARSVAEKTDQTMLREPGFGMLQHYLTTPLRMMVRFGRWDDILAEPAFPDDLTYPRGNWHYARGMAFTARGQLAEASAELESLAELAADPRTAEVDIFGFNPGNHLLEIAHDVLAGRLAAASGDVTRAVQVLRRGVQREDALTYDEPPDWHLPVRQILGAVLLDAGQVREAEAVYVADLAKYPENGWSLFGLVQSLRAQGRVSDAGEATGRFQAAWRAADVVLTRSAF
jgi:tetratricopeptide (TPR) repeat protein